MLKKIITSEIRKYLEFNENNNTTYQKHQHAKNQYLGHCENSTKGEIIAIYA